MDNEWHQSVEILLSRLGDESQIRQKLHSRHANWYQARHNRYNIPIVILSVVSGSGAFLSEHFVGLGKKVIVLAVGGISIITSVISSISTYLKLAQLGEGHRLAALSWGKFFSKIS